MMMSTEMGPLLYCGTLTSSLSRSGYRNFPPMCRRTTVRWGWTGYWCGTRVSGGACAELAGEPLPELWHIVVGPAGWRGRSRKVGPSTIRTIGRLTGSSAGELSRAAPADVTGLGEFFHGLFGYGSDVHLASVAEEVFSHLDDLLCLVASGDPTAGVVEWDEADALARDEPAPSMGSRRTMSR